MGPGVNANQDASGQVWHVDPACSALAPIVVGTDGTASPTHILPFDDTHWLVASGGSGPDAKRGIYVVTAALELCGPLPGFDEAWSTAVGELNPIALALTPGKELVVSAGPPAGVSAQDGVFGKVLWATLQGVDDPCSMSAEVTDLSDGILGHAPVVDPALPATHRSGGAVVLMAEVSG